MKYFLGTQFVPQQGEAKMYYEVGEDGKVTRSLTFITGTSQITRVPDPIVKKLINPGRLNEVNADEFIELYIPALMMDNLL